MKKFMLEKLFLLGFFGVFAVKVLAHPAAVSVNVPGAGIFNISLSDDYTVLNLKFSPKNNKPSVYYNQKEFDQCSMMSLYRIPGTETVAIDGSCPSRDGQIYVRIYKWDAPKEKWCLIRNITGQRPDLESGDWEGASRVERIEGCPTIGNDDSFVTLNEVQSLRDEEFELQEILKRNLKSTFLKKNLDNVPYYFPLELSSDIKKINIQYANDLAYYLVEAGRASDALPLLQAIVNAYPERVVAKLNFADALWQIGEKNQAKNIYLGYEKQMQSENKSVLIPSRVVIRVKQAY